MKATAWAFVIAGGLLAGCNPPSSGATSASASAAASTATSPPAAAPATPAPEPYTAEERAERAASFQAYDFNDDGRLQRSELARAVQAQSARMISRYDLDENGGLSRPELDNTRTPVEQLEELFLADADRNGVLTPEELQREADAAFTRRDANRDDEQTLEEWLTRPPRV